MKRYRGSAQFGRLQAVLARRKAIAAKPEPAPDWIARIAGLGGLTVAVAAFALQFAERSTPFNVELYVAQLASYREVTSASRELTHDLPDYVFWPDRQSKEARQKLRHFRDTMEANSMMWDEPIALRLEELAHSIDLVLLGLDGGTETNPTEGLYILHQQKPKAGASPERVRLLTQIAEASVDSARWMKQELERQRRRAEQSR